MLKPKPRPPACDCPEHVEDGAPTELFGHRFQLQVNEDSNPPRTYWRARCTCRRGRGSQWQCQSDSVAYHAWRAHVARYAG